MISARFQHYVGRICNTIYRMMSFVDFFLANFARLWGSCFDMLKFLGEGRECCVCGDAHVVLHISDPPEMFSTDKSYCSQKEIFSQIIVNSMIFCVWMSSIFIGQFCNFARDSVIPESLGPLSTCYISNYQMDWDVLQKCFNLACIETTSQTSTCSIFLEKNKTERLLKVELNHR